MCVGVAIHLVWQMRRTPLTLYSSGISKVEYREARFCSVLCGDETERTWTWLSRPSSSLKTASMLITGSMQGFFPAMYQQQCREGIQQ